MRSSESVVEVFTIRPPSPAYTPPPVNVPAAEPKAEPSGDDMDLDAILAEFK